MTHVRENLKTLASVTVLTLFTSSFVGIAHGQTQNGISITPGTITRWADKDGSLTDSVIYEDPDTGRVGIGTSNPRTPLQLNKDGDYAQATFETFAATNPDASSILTLLRARGTEASPAAVLSGDNLGGVFIGGHSGTGFAERANIVGTAAENWSPSGFGTKLRFFTTGNGATSPQERLVINHDGNLGVGTTTPFSRLHVQNGDSGLSIPERVDGIIGECNSGLSRICTGVRGLGGENGVGVTGETATALRPGVRAISANGLDTNRGLDVTGGANITGQVALRNGQLFPASYRLVLEDTFGPNGRGIANRWDTYSSRRWKTNIQTIQGALGTVERLRGVSFDWKKNGAHDIGLIAEEVGELVPDLVTYEENGKDARGLDYARLAPLLVEAVKELKRENEGLKSRIDKLESQY